AAGGAGGLRALADHPKRSPPRVGGRAIRARMLAALHVVGVRRAVIVVGHCADQVRAVAAAAPAGMTVECIDNPAYQRGSSLSLYCARDVIAREATFIMDARVVFPRGFFRRLRRSPPGAGVLVCAGVPPPPPGREN